MATPVDKTPFAHLYPFDSHFVEINGWNCHYLDEGAGEPLLMLHGNPTWSFYYRELVKRFSPDFRVVCPDHIGCGLSDKPPADQYGYRLKDRVNDIETLVNHLNLDGITLIVHDWGGFIGCAFALRNLEKIKRVVITNTAAFLKISGKPIPARLRVLRHIAPFAVPAVLGANLFARAALYMAPKKKLPPDVKAGLIAPYNSWANRIATLKFVQDIALSEKDPSYEMGRFLDDNLYKLSGFPMLICWGLHDFVFDTDYFAEWQRRFPHAESHGFETAGHYLLEDEPEQVGDRIKAFLKKHP
ncbi:alpha/beta fold hydrolase [Desulfosudis oleivorans]|uniref:Alpha/beta hydrolase fold n=1 Tax=Desulfosudis oleivorans (strain DSM 6200 / JCM 39069 / Hxd3) TaxID=96561 RepID=A8ZTD0_DESOH|nr:alpha/beta fold hydrolase [Desulfosudis oleivorans]ABW67813.1 alpha/beta hydrolase fold [Desulfosudis oleivorans Hxd3]